MSLKKLFKKKIKVANIGLESFKDDLEKQEQEVVNVDWKPPVEIENITQQILDDNKESIEKANEKVIQIILSGKPTLIGLDIARNVIPNMKENLLLHSGPPLTWNRMSGPMKGAVIGALIYEGKANTKEEAEKLASSNEIEFSPCHEHNTVGPMAGVVSASMPVFIIKNEEYGNLAFCTLNEGLGKVLRYGAYSPEVIERLKWMESDLYPTLKSAMEVAEKIDLKNMIAQALHMGDEIHNRNRAGNSLFYRSIAPAIIQTAKDTETAIKVLEFINGNDHFFLNLSMPACKATLDAARNIENSSIVIAMTRNGTDFGLQLAGTKNEWFVGAALVPDALYFPGFTKEDANPDIGDSSITETNGLGGFAIAASPAIVQFVGGTANDAVNYTMAMYEITAGENNIYQIPYLNFRGTPTGIDVMKVIDKSVLPFIDTGVAHKEPGIGQVGAGVLSAPIEPFKKAVAGLAESIKKNLQNSEELI
ncbi:MAG: DUF1116 domain-containing protein [Candidatus Cloacimonetes bacterium]|nr:DUF1116 domain-containing protein [Candidatus Cloacimonadota bacterium]